MPPKDEIQRIKKLIRNHHRRLQALEERKALYGIDTPLAILTEIEDIQVEIEELEEQLQNLEQRTENLEDKTARTVATESLTTDAVTKGGTPWIWIGLGSVAAVVVISLVIFVALNDQGRENPTATNTVDQTIETETPTPTDTPEATSTNAPQPLPTPKLIAPKNGVEFLVSKKIDFRWKKSELADDQRYVFIIEDDGNSYCDDPEGCSDVHWILWEDSHFTLPAGQWFFVVDKDRNPVSENILRWKVVVSTTGDDHYKSENTQPVSTVVASEIREFTLSR